MKNCKSMKGAIQQRTGPKGGKQWRCGNGPWQYGEPPKPKEAAGKSSSPAGATKWQQHDYVHHDGALLRIDNVRATKNGVRYDATEVHPLTGKVLGEVTIPHHELDQSGHRGAAPTARGATPAHLLEARGTAAWKKRHGDEE